MRSDTHINEFGFFFFLRMAVAVASSSRTSLPEGSLCLILVSSLSRNEAEMRVLVEVDLGLLARVLRLCRHDGCGV